MFVHAHKYRRAQRTTTNAELWSSALGKRVTNADAHPANDNALAKIIPVIKHLMQCCLRIMALTIC